MGTLRIFIFIFFFFFCLIVSWTRQLNVSQKRAARRPALARHSVAVARWWSVWGWLVRVWWRCCFASGKSIWKWGREKFWEIILGSFWGAKIFWEIRAKIGWCVLCGQIIIKNTRIWLFLWLLSGFCVFGGQLSRLVRKSGLERRFWVLRGLVGWLCEKWGSG